MAKTQQFKPEEVIQALRTTRGMVYLAAEALGCSAETVYRYMRRYTSVRKAKEDATERMLDWGEVKLFNRVMAEDVSAIKYLLSTKGKHRGYTEKESETHINVNVRVGLMQARERLSKALAQTGERLNNAQHNGHRD